MKLNYLCLILCLIVLNKTFSQNLSISGTVVSDDGEIPFVNVSIKGSTIGTSSNENGNFKIENLESKKYELVFSVLGFKRLQKEIDLSNGKSTDLKKVRLDFDALGLDEMVVTGTMTPTFVSMSPIKIDVITSRHLKVNMPSTNIVDGIKMVNGVQEVVACGVCFTNSISINGLPGPYTAVLMDGAPIYGNLASVYGLNGIPTQIIDRFEVIKGPSSTLYGSEAVAGVINVITKDPFYQPLLEVDLMGTSHFESFGNIALAPKFKKAAGYVGLYYAYINDFDDDNLDGFADNVNMDQYSFFTKWNFKRKNNRKFNVSAKLYYEDRRNGVEEFLSDRAYKKLRGNDSIYGESIYTNRAEIFGTYDIPITEKIKIDFSLSDHFQDSYYGSDYYTARQKIGFSNIVWNKKLSNHNLLFGQTTRLQYYDDNTVATEDSINGKIINNPDNQIIPGVFAQNEWNVSEAFTLLGGLRLDNYEQHGPILSPRLNLKLKPKQWSTYRLNFGTGFRIVNLFTEDHAFVSGQREVIIAEELKPEKSYNLGLNFNHLYTIGNQSGMFDVDGYYTYFTNKIIPNYDSPDAIVYKNSIGYATTMGISFSLNHQFKFPLSFNSGFNLQRVIQVEEVDEGEFETSEIEFAPRWSGNLTVNYKLKPSKWTFAYTSTLTGPMKLPEVFDLDIEGNPQTISRPIVSQAFLIHNIQVIKNLSKTFEFYAGVQNIMDFRQKESPLVGYNDPNAPIGFSKYFDTSYAYAPIHGREFYLGIRMNVDKLK